MQCDWITIGSPGSSECKENYALMAATFDWLGCPLVQDKTEGPTTCLEYLGVPAAQASREIADDPAGVARLHETSLQSLIGLLQHVAVVVHPRCIFMRQMCEFLKSVNKPGYHIKPNRGF